MDASPEPIEFDARVLPSESMPLGTDYDGCSAPWQVYDPKIPGQSELLVVCYCLSLTEDDNILGTEPTSKVESEPLVSPRRSNQVPLDYKASSVTTHPLGE